MLKNGCKRKFAEQGNCPQNIPCWRFSEQLPVNEDLCTLQRISYWEGTRRNIVKITCTENYREISLPPLQYNVALCVRRDPGGAARGPGERRRGAVARPPARPRHPRHTVDPR